MMPFTDDHKLLESGVEGQVRLGLTVEESTAETRISRRNQTGKERRKEYSAERTAYARALKQEKS